MKYIIVLGDGISDEPISELDGKTPLEYANTPYMDELASMSEIGLAVTIPDGMSPGSDTANLAVLGYDPKVYYTGRSPLEALSIGVDMEDGDVALRCNLVTLSDDARPYEEKSMIDHSSGEITTNEAVELIKAVRNELQSSIYRFYEGKSYRHLTIWKGGEAIDLTPPHDVLGRAIGEYLPRDEHILGMMMQSHEILNHHPINAVREKRGLNKANSIWFWGAGTRPGLDSFYEKFGKRAAMISAVDLLKGIAVGSGMDNIFVEGADGTLHTNWEGKADAAVDALLNRGYDFVYVHLEAPDEMGHQGNLGNKILAIEYLDARIIERICRKMDEQREPYRMLVMPDHPTPVSRRTHTSDPVPYLLYDSGQALARSWKYNEREARGSGNFVKDGHGLILKLFNQM